MRRDLGGEMLGIEGADAPQLNQEIGRDLRGLEEARAPVHDAVPDRLDGDAPGASASTTRGSAAAWSGAVTCRPSPASKARVASERPIRSTIPAQEARGGSPDANAANFRLDEPALTARTVAMGSMVPTPSPPGQSGPAGPAGAPMPRNWPMRSDALSPEPVRTRTVVSSGRMAPLARSRLRPAAAAAAVGST